MWCDAQAASTAFFIAPHFPGTSTAMTQAISSPSSLPFQPASDPADLPRPDLAEYPRATRGASEPSPTTPSETAWHNALSLLEDVVFAAHPDAVKAIADAFQSIAHMRIVSAERTDEYGALSPGGTTLIDSEMLAQSIATSLTSVQARLDAMSLQAAQFMRAEVVAGEFDFRSTTPAVIAADSLQLALLFMGKVAEQNPQARPYFSLVALHLSDGYRHDVFHAVRFDNRATPEDAAPPASAALQSTTLSAPEFTAYLLDSTRECALIMPSLAQGKILTLAGFDTYDALEMHLAMMFEQTRFMCLPIARVELLTVGLAATPHPPNRICA